MPAENNCPLAACSMQITGWLSLEWFY